MSQHDYTIANQGFPATRADINNALSAIATNNSGTSAPSTQYAGQFWIDTTSSTWTMYIHDGTDDIQFATIDTSANTVNFTDSALDVVTDTTPQLGGDLDSNGNNILFDDGTGINDDDDNELIRFQKIASAVNQIDISNSATGNAPEISATGDDTNIDLNLTPKGTGSIIIPNGKISGHNYPAFFARKLGTQALTSDTDTKMIADDEVFDTDSAYDTSTGAFTVPTGQGGKYFFTYGFSVQNIDDAAAVAVNIKVNGSFIEGTSVLSGSYSFLNTAYNGSNVDDPSVAASALLVLSAGDYVEMWGRQRDNTTENARYLRFGAFRIGA